ncbi:hypothetical protein BpHYR1_035596 [Brachionus plicatilis]|uniref:Uncharacterized protein n=1 Tax=Brachionus plicatilis TaxID=10195 RepID=A0A3M7RA38_BRAPC|nr:hypothetical protein BpHYR1_035596 [Brachionus plicatilis]
MLEKTKPTNLIDSKKKTQPEVCEEFKIPVGTMSVNGNGFRNGFILKPVLSKPFYQAFIQEILIKNINSNPNFQFFFISRINLMYTKITILNFPFDVHEYIASIDGLTFHVNLQKV